VFEYHAAPRSNAAVVGYGRPTRRRGQQDDQAAAGNRECRSRTTRPRRPRRRICTVHEQPPCGAAATSNRRAARRSWRTYRPTLMIAILRRINPRKHPNSIVIDDCGLRRVRAVVDVLWPRRAGCRHRVKHHPTCARTRMLYGFATGWRRAFERLIGVSGLGAKVALARVEGCVLPLFFWRDRAGELNASDRAGRYLARLTAIPRVGKKKSERSCSN